MKNNEFLKLSAIELISGYKKGSYTISDVIETALEHIEANERNLMP